MRFFFVQFNLEKFKTYALILMMDRMEYLYSMIQNFVSKNTMNALDILPWSLMMTSLFKRKIERNMNRIVVSNKLRPQSDSCELYGIIRISPKSISGMLK